jgi:hypothetical protein
MYIYNLKSSNLHTDLKQEQHDLHIIHKKSGWFFSSNQQILKRKETW